MFFQKNRGQAFQLQNQLKTGKEEGARANTDHDRRGGEASGKRGYEGARGRGYHTHAYRGRATSSFFFFEVVVLVVGESERASELCRSFPRL